MKNRLLVNWRNCEEFDLEGPVDAGQKSCCGKLDALRSRLPGDRKLAPTRVEPRLVRPVWRINSTPTLPAASSSNANKGNGQRAFHGVAQLPLRILPAKYLILWHSKLYGSLAHKQMVSTKADHSLDKQQTM